MSDAPILDPSNVPVTPAAATSEPSITPVTTTTEPPTTTEPGTTTTSAEPPSGAPDTYADFRAPEGTKLDPDAIAAALPMFKELNLTQEAAQKIVDMQAQREAGLLKQANDAYNGQRAEWRSQVEREYGTNNLNQMRADVGQALSTIPEATRKEFFDAMAVTGAGDNPAFIKVFHALAKQVIEGKPVTGAPRTPPAARPGFAESLFPNLANAPQSG